MLWLALHLPLLSLEAFSATLPPDRRAAPLALLADHRIAAVNPAAAARGLRPGLKRATALALAADLLIGQADAARDMQALQAVAHAALAFTPMVALQGADIVLLEVQASLRLFGGAARLLDRLRAALAPLGHRLQTAAAPTPGGAALLARWGTTAHGTLHDGPHCTDLAALQRLLDQAPVWLLGPGRQHWEALQGMGLHRLADLRALPRGGLARRFGVTLLAELDSARGDRPDPRQPVALPPAFDSRLELFARADTSEQVLHGALVLLARLLAWAQAQQARVAGFRLRMAHERHRHGEHPPHTDLSIALAEPAADLRHLQALLRERLAHCELAAPTLELHLHCRQIVRAPAPNGELFLTRQGEREGLLRLLERLRARLGEAQVQALQTVADHRPERASRAAPLSFAALSSPTGVATAPPGALPLHRPAWLLPEPQPLAERQALPLLDGRPLQLLSGPERIEAGWWDAALAARDYFIAQAEDGALVWIYRTRLPSVAGSAAGPGGSGWVLQGRFG
ncbi:MAG: DNA polymerase Y family protein [Rubrivivax sp.]|nr:DNA polymerase Y family protein [Rubrivivax sp.]